MMNHADWSIEDDMLIPLPTPKPLPPLAPVENYNPRYKNIQEKIDSFFERTIKTLEKKIFTAEDIDKNVSLYFEYLHLQTNYPGYKFKFKMDEDTGFDEFKLLVTTNKTS